MKKKFLTAAVMVLVLVMTCSLVLGIANVRSLPVYAEGETNTEASGEASNTTDNPGSEPKKQNPWTFVIWIAVYAVLFGLLYLVLIRPQQKKRKKEEAERASLMVGDNITTIGGIVGRVVKIQDDDVTVESSIDRTLVTFKNWAIRDIQHVVTDDEQ